MLLKSQNWIVVQTLLPFSFLPTKARANHFFLRCPCSPYQLKNYWIQSHFCHKMIFTPRNSLFVPLAWTIPGFRRLAADQSEYRYSILEITQAGRASGVFRADGEPNYRQEGAWQTVSLLTAWVMPFGGRWMVYWLAYFYFTIGVNWSVFEICWPLV